MITVPDYRAGCAAFCDWLVDDGKNDLAAEVRSFLPDPFVGLFSSFTTLENDLFDPRFSCATIDRASVWVPLLFRFFGVTPHQDHSGMIDLSVLLSARNTTWSGSVRHLARRGRVYIGTHSTLGECIIVATMLAGYPDVVHFPSNFTSDARSQVTVRNMSRLLRVSV